MSNDPNIDPGGQGLAASDVNVYFPEHDQPGTSRDVVTQPQGPFPQYMVTDDNMWIQPITGQVYEDEYGNYREIRDIDQQPGQIEEVYLLPDEERDVELMRSGVGSLQVAAHEVVVDEMLGTSVEPEQYIQQVPGGPVLRSYTRPYVQPATRQNVRQAQSQPMMTVPGPARVRYIVQHTSQTVEIEQDQPIQYDVRPMAMFEGPSNQALIPQQQQTTRRIPNLRSRSKSQPRRSLYGDLEDDSLAYLVQEHDEGDWDGVQLEDHEYFIGGQQEREAILNSNEDELSQSALPPPRIIQRPYFPPNLSPTEKKEYLFINYKKACDRYFPFANVAVLEADTRYKPVEAFASDLYRFHSRGAHIHGFFRTVIDVRDRPSHDQTRYIQDIQFGKVFPLFPDYDEWDDKMREEFRQLSNRLMRIFERKCFYAQSGGSHGKAPVVKRGRKATPKPPPNYAEEQKVQAAGIPKGFQPLRAAYSQSKPGPSKHPLPPAAAVVHPGSSTSRLVSVNDEATLNESIAVPQEVGAPRVEAFEHNKRVDMKRVVNDAFVSREPLPAQYQEVPPSESSDPRSLVCRVPPGPSKTLRHQRSIATKAIRMIANRAVEPVIDPSTGRYVVSLENLRLPNAARPPTVETARRYIPRPVHTLREMADSARRGPNASNQSNWIAGNRVPGARVSRIDQAPRYTFNSAASVSAQHQQLPSTSASSRAPLLKDAVAPEFPQGPGVHPGAAVTALPTTRNDHVYPRSHSSGRTATPSSSYRRSASSGRPITAAAESRRVDSSADDDIDEIIQVDDDPVVVDASRTQLQAPATTATVAKQTSTTVAQRKQPQASDQNTAPASAKATSESREQKGEKRIVQVRDEFGFLRRCTRLPDGTLVVSSRTAKAMTKLRIPPLGADGRAIATQEHTRAPTAGAVYAMHSMGRKEEKRPGTQPEQQWKRSQASVAPWSHTATVAPQRQGSNERSQEGRIESSMKARTKRKDVLYSDNNDDIIVISDHAPEKKGRSQSQRSRSIVVVDQDPGVVDYRRSRTRTPKLLSRICEVPQTTKTEEQEKEATRRRLMKKEEEDSENVIIDVVTEDAKLSEEIKELISSLPPPEPSELEEMSPGERKKAGRPPKKFRGRLARQKQAIRDAEIAEKVAIKQRELPVLDLALKVIDDPSVEVPEEAPIVVDSLATLDATLLHEVGEVLKEMVTQVSLEELKPKKVVRARNRRCWEHLPGRVPSKRQEYRALRVPPRQQSPPPPPLRTRARGRNWNKRYALDEKSEELSGSDISFGPIDYGLTLPKDAAASRKIAENTSTIIVTPVKNAQQAPKESITSLSEQTQSLQISGRAEAINASPKKRSPKASERARHSGSSSGEREATSVSYDEVNLNEEDLVDINVDPFFSSTENFDSSASGDETDTPSRKIKKKFKELLGEPGSSTSPRRRVTRTRASNAIAEQKKAASVPGSTPNVVASIPSVQDYREQPKDEFSDFVEELVATTAHRLSLEDSQRHLNAEAVAAPAPTQLDNLLDSSVDVCNKVETMLDVMELSLQGSQVVPTSEDGGLHAGTPQGALTGENLSSTQQFVKPFVAYTDENPADIAPGPQTIEELMEEIEAEFAGMTYPSLPDEYDTPTTSATQQFPSLDLQPVMREPIEFADTVDFEACRRDQHYRHLVTIAIPGADAYRLSLPQEVQLDLVAPDKSEQRKDYLHAEISLADYGCITTEWKTSFRTTRKRLTRSGAHAEVLWIVNVPNREKARLNVIESHSSLFPQTTDRAKGQLAEYDFERAHLSASKTIPLPLLEHWSLRALSKRSTVRRAQVKGDTSHTVPCANVDSAALSEVTTGCALALADPTDVATVLNALKEFDAVDLHATCPSKKPPVSLDRIVSPIPEDTSDGLTADEDIEWKNISRLKRIDLQKSYAKLSPSDLALLKGDGVRLPISEESGRVTAAANDKAAEKRDSEIATDVCNVLEGLKDTISKNETETAKSPKIREDIPLAVPTPEVEDELEPASDVEDMYEDVKELDEPMEVTEYSALQPSEPDQENELLEEAITEEAQEDSMLTSVPVTILPSDQAVSEEFVSSDTELLATESSGRTIEFTVEHVITVSKDVERCSLGPILRAHKKRRKRVKKKTGEDLIVDYNTSVATDSNKISEYLRSEDTPDSGFSEATFLEQCYLQSPDLFGIGEGTRKKKRKVSKPQKWGAAELSRGRADEFALTPIEKRKPCKYTLLQTDVKAALDRLWRREDPKLCHGQFGSLVELCRSKIMNLALGTIHFDQGFMATEKIWSGLGRSLRDTAKSPCPRGSTIAIMASRPRNHLISDFNLTMIKPMNPIVRCEADMGPLLVSLQSTSPLRLSRPRVEGSLENAFAQYDKGVDCILQQVSCARSIVENIRSTTHWSLHFLMDAQLFMLDILYEMWEYTARSVQLAVFNAYQCSLWEKHHQIFDARMYCLLFEMNAAAALSAKIDTCCSYIRRFEEWNRKTNNFSSVYNHVYGLALSMIKLIAIPNTLKRLQSMTHWNSKARSTKSSEEIFTIDLIPFFQVGTCSLTSDDLEIEKLLDGKKSLVTDTLEHLLSFEAAQDNNRVDSFSFLFPSHSVVKLCQSQIQKEVSSYYNKHLEDVMHLDHHQLSMLSPIARAYILSRIHEARAKSLMRNNIMNLDKLIGKLNIAFDELSKNVEEMNQAEFDYPCGQVVFDYSGGKVNVCINTVENESAEPPSPSLIDEARRLMGDAVKNTVFHPSTPVAEEKEDMVMKSDRIQKSVDLVKNWVMTIPSTYDEVQNDSKSRDTVEDYTEITYPSSPARITVIDDEDDDEEDESPSPIPKKKRKQSQSDTVTTTIAGRKIWYNIDTEQGLLKMKSVDSNVTDASTDCLTATNTITTASFNSFDQIETLKIIRSPETGELDWLAMIENALEAAPPPETLPSFLQKNEPLEYQTIDIMKAHEYANHFVRDTDINGEFLDLRKQTREKIRQFQLVDYFERKRNARFEAISSNKSLEMPRPGPDERDKIPMYAIWLRDVLQYAEIEKKRLTALKPINNIGRCRAARSEMIREFNLPIKRRKRSTSSPSWLGRTIYDHFGEFFSLGMARLEYEVAGRNMHEEGQVGTHDDTITHYFVSRNNSPSTMIDPLDLLEDPYAYFRPTPTKRKRTVSPLVESSLVKRLHMSDPPVFAPFALVDEPETLYPPCCSDYDSSDEDE
ncbi:hypothetical protein V3C99_017574 [Haemonchus contortus]